MYIDLLEPGSSFELCSSTVFWKIPTVLTVILLGPQTRLKVISDKQEMYMYVYGCMPAFRSLYLELPRRLIDTPGGEALKPTEVYNNI